VTLAGEKVHVTVDAGDVLDHTVLRSYCIGAVHQALGWVMREGLAVDQSGQVLDLTIRSFGVFAARDTPEIEVEILGTDPDGEAKSPVNGSDAVFAAAAAAFWIASGLAPKWPVESWRSGGAGRNDAGSRSTTTERGTS
jgi:CO/xanthine dehydrogenase Mo-binding subunit